MDARLIVFVALVALVAGSPMLQKKASICERGIEFYCKSESLARHCNRVEYCDIYNTSPCLKPENFCKNKETAANCNKEAYCLTWPDDEVTAVRILSPEEKSLAFEIKFGNSWSH